VNATVRHNHGGKTLGMLIRKANLDTCPRCAFLAVWKQSKAKQKFAPQHERVVDTSGRRKTLAELDRDWS
jgi:hypothetical protein